jgi:hypothetical protein
MTEKQQAIITYGCMGLQPNEKVILSSSPPLANFVPKAIIVQDSGNPTLPKAMDIIKNLDTFILDDEAVDLSSTQQGPGFVRCDLPEKETRTWTTGKVIPISLISKEPMGGFQLLVLGDIP